jgi:hypothetical protein
LWLSQGLVNQENPNAARTRRAPLSKPVLPAPAAGGGVSVATPAGYGRASILRRIAKAVGSVLVVDLDGTLIRKAQIG